MLLKKPIRHFQACLFPQDKEHTADQHDPEVCVLRVLVVALVLEIMQQRVYLECLYSVSAANQPDNSECKIAPVTQVFVFFGLFHFASVFTVLHFWQS